MKLRSLHNTTSLEFFVPDYSTKLELPFFDVGISAGVIDKMNKSFGTNKVKFATQSLGKQWKMKQEKLSPCYTTKINGIITVK